MRMIAKHRMSALASALLVLSVAVLLTCCVSVSRAFAADAPSVEKQTVRVGYFAFDGYHMIDSDGTYSGYGYDLMQDLARYNNWNLEFIGYDKSWAEMQQMLADGEIDVLTSAQKTSAREELFDFSDEDVGTSLSILTVKAGDTSIASGDYSTYDGIRVGMIESSSRNAGFAEFAAEKGFSYTPVYYEDTEKLAAALQDGTDIDAILTSSLRSSENEWVLDEFDASPFYVMVRKGDTELLDEVNSAIAEFDLDSPGWRTSLASKYYSTDAGDSLSFNADERKYLDRTARDGVVFKVAVNPDNAPYSYLDDKGVPTGILPQVFAEMAHNIGISYEYIETPTAEDYDTVVSSGEADIVIDSTVSLFEANRRGYQLTDPYLSTTISRLTLRRRDGDITTVCMPADVAEVVIEQDGATSDDKPRYVIEGSVQECVDAVLDGTCDAAYLYTYTARDRMDADERNRLSVLLMPEYSVDVSMAVAQRLDSRLVTVLDKGGHSTSEYADQTMLSQASSASRRGTTFIGFLYTHPAFVVGVIAILAALIIVLIVAIGHMRNARLERRRRAELERFVGYLCRSYDLVMEFRLTAGERTRYLLEDDHVIERKDKVTLSDEAISSFIHPDDVGPVLEHFSMERLYEIADRNGNDQIECRMRFGHDLPDAGADGSNASRGSDSLKEVYRWYLVVVQDVPTDDEQQRSIMLMIRDIDDIKRKQEDDEEALTEALLRAQKASEAKSTFLSSMSHDMRTPLNGIIGFTELALNSDDGAKRQDYLGKIYASGELMLDLVNDTLDLSKIESGKMVLEERPVEMSMIFETIIDAVGISAKRRHITFLADASNADFGTIRVDRPKIQQVFLNLLSNAIKYTPQGGNVRFELRRLDPPVRGCNCLGTVSDDGIGMAEDFLPHVFEPFSQEHAKGYEEVVGTGLGLAIVDRIVDLMGGFIEVSSTRGIGSTFSVYLPLDVVKANEVGDIGADEPEEDIDLTGMRVLLCEDNRLNAEIACTLLDSHGVTVVTAPDGAEGVEEFARSGQGSFDAVLMDLRMPVMDGYHAAAAIRALERSDAATVPIIAMSADAYSDDVEHCRAMGMDGHIPKPVDPKLLFSVLGKIRGGHDGEWL